MLVSVTLTPMGQRKPPRKKLPGQRGKIVRVRCPLCGSPVHARQLHLMLATSCARDEFVLFQPVRGRGHGKGAIGKAQVLLTFSGAAAKRAAKLPFDDALALDTLGLYLSRLVMRWLELGLLDRSILTRAKVFDTFERLAQQIDPKLTEVGFCKCAPPLKGLGIESMRLDDIFFTPKAPPLKGLGIERA